MRSTLLRAAAIAIGAFAVVLVLAGLLRLPGVGDWPAWPAWAPWVGLALATFGLWAAWRVERHEHAVRRDTPDEFLGDGDEARLAAAIRAFESRTSGEIRVHIATTCAGDPLAEATRVFEQLGMRRTRRRNAVLFYVAVEQRRLAVVGDAGIDARVEAGFWDDVIRAVEAGLADGKHAGGLLRGIELAGEALVAHFPPDPEDTNELPDQLTRS